MLSLATPPARPLVAASVLSADFGRIADDARDVLHRGADLLHVDVMDGHFVSNLTMGQDMLRGLRKHLPDAFLDAHLMVERPADYVAPFAQAGCNHVTFHLEVTRPFHPNGHDPAALIRDIRHHGMTAGIALNPYTPPDLVEPLLAELSMVLVMSVVPGRSGQAFMPAVLDKVRWLKGRLPRSCRLEMDGGINPDTVRDCVAAGADTLVTASALFSQTGDARTRVIQALHNA